MTPPPQPFPQRTLAGAVGKTRSEAFGRAGSIYISAVLSHGWAKASACCFQVCLSCAVLCQVVSFQYSSKSSLHLFAGLPRNLFLPYGFQVVMRFVHLSSLSRLMCPAQDHFILLVVFITSVTPVFALTARGLIGKYLNKKDTVTDMTIALAEAISKMWR